VPGENDKGDEAEIRANIHRGSGRKE
jgi:hypothetical protein